MTYASIDSDPDARAAQDGLTSFKVRLVNDAHGYERDQVVAINAIDESAALLVANKIDRFATATIVRDESSLPNDGRPCATDVFLVALLEQIDDHYDQLDAIESWLEGDWDAALEGVTLQNKEG